MLDKNLHSTPSVTPLIDLTRPERETYPFKTEDQADFVLAIGSARFLYSKQLLNPLEFVTMVLRAAQNFVDCCEICLDSRYAHCSFLEEQPLPIIDLGYHRWTQSPLYIA